MFPMGDGPFVAMRGPFIAAAGGSVSVVNGTVSVSGTQITFPATSSGSLVGGVYGVEFGIGVGAGYVWSENVAGAASSQTITIDIATYGGTTTSTVNAQTYYNLDPLDDPATRVYSAMLVPLVNSASLTGTTTEGQTLTGANGIIVGGYPMTLTQQWQRCNSGGSSCSNITGETATTYLLAAADVGNTIKYTKTATNTAGSGSATSNASAVVASGLSPEAAAVINSYTTPPSAPQQAAIAAFVDTLVANGGAWTKLDGLYVTAAPAEADCMQNWKSPGTYNLAKVGTVTFVSNAYMSGNGTNGRLEGATALNNAAFQLTTSSGHIGVFTNGDDQNKTSAGSTTAGPSFYLQSSNTFGSANAAINSNGSANKARTNTTGHVCASRTGTTTTNIYDNGAQIGTTDTELSFSENSGVFTLGGSLTDYNTVRILAGHFGAGLTAAEVDVINDAMVTYFTAIGAYP